MVNPAQMKQTHLLNDDALKMYFSSAIEANQIIIRKCFIDGYIHRNDLEKLYGIREGFLESVSGKVQYKSFQLTPEKSSCAEQPLASDQTRAYIYENTKSTLSPRLLNRMQL